MMGRRNEIDSPPSSPPPSREREIIFFDHGDASIRESQIQKKISKT
jgi:hypothetical protein